MEKSRTDFTNEYIERLLLKRCLTDRKYLGILSPMFDKRWIDNENITTLIGLEIWFFNKYKEIPSAKTLENLAAKYAEAHPNVDIAKISEELSIVGSMDSNLSDDVIKSNIKEFIESKAMFWAISDNIKQIENDKNVDKCLDRFNKIRKMTFEDTDLGLDYFSKEGQDSHWDYITNPEAKLRTMWDGLDAETHGGFLKDGKMVALFCGQAGLGKSLFLSNIAYNFLRQNLRVVVISLEMSENVYGRRFSAHISNDNINKLAETCESSRGKIDNFYKNHPSANLIIKEYPPRTIRVQDVENYLDRLRDNGQKFDVIIIDYLNLLLPNSKFDNMYQDMMAVSEQLRALSYKYEAPVFSASQFNRSGMNNPNVGIENISDSSGLSFTADFIGLLYQGEEDREHGIINMRLGKNRFGSPGKTIQFRLNPDSLVLNDESFSEHPENDTTEAEEILRNIGSLSGDVETL